MDASRTPRRPRRALRWLIGLAIVAALLVAYAITLDRVATRIGLDAESTMRATPLDDDTRHRRD